MTMQGLADAAGVHRDTVGRWCTDDGIGGMRMKDAESVAAALGCRVSDLYGETGEAPSGR